MTSALQPLARLSSRMVLPVPKPPGIAPLPPSATGNSESRTRCPVTSGSSDGRRASTGRGVRTGQKCDIASACSAPSASTSVTSVASSLYSPAGWTVRTSPPTVGAASASCSRPWPGCRRPNRWPGARVSPGETLGVNWSLACGGACMPGAMREPVPCSGRMRPSKILPSRAGPTRMPSSAPVPSTGTPGMSPVVSS